MKTRKGVNYYETVAEASEVLRSIATEYPSARIVGGFFWHLYAVQYYKSGPYYPEAPRADDRFNPAVSA